MSQQSHLPGLQGLMCGLNLLHVPQLVSDHWAVTTMTWIAPCMNHIISTAQDHSGCVCSDKPWEVLSKGLLGVFKSPTLEDSEMEKLSLRPPGLQSLQASFAVNLKPMRTMRTNAALGISLPGEVVVSLDAEQGGHHRLLISSGASNSSLKT